MLLKERRSWTTRPYEEGDEEQIIELFERVFGKPMGITESRKHWKWEYMENPVEKIYVNLAVDDDRIVGQYAVIPVEMWIHGRRKIGSLSLDTMVHPDYRGQGMFTTLAEQLYRELARDGVVLTYGFPNANSIHGFTNRLEWKEIFKIPLFARPIDFDRSATMMFGDGVKGSLASFFSKKLYDLKYRPKSPSSGYTMEEIQGFDSHSIFRPPEGISAVKSSEYLNWRFTEKPEFDYTKIGIWKKDILEGYAVVIGKRYGDHDIGFIVDMMTKDQKSDTAELLLSRSIQEAERSSCDILSYIAPNNGRYSEMLKKLGFIGVDPKKFPQDIYFGVRENVTGLNCLFDPNKWTISWADTDLV
ncbi:MAG: GNAT family N-acetyltransferase [Thermoplasmata archaeon]